MSDETKRVIDQTTDSSLSAGDYVIVDSESEGTRKFDLGTELTDIKQDLQDIQAEIEGGGSGMSTAFKQALHNILEKVAYADNNGQTYLDALDDAMYPPVTAISLNTNSLSFATLNSTQQLIATTTPIGGAVTWSSSNNSVATVSSSGLVTSVGYGNVIITAASGSVSATCSVVVAQATLLSISAVYTQSGTIYDNDSLDALKPDLVVTAHWSNSTTSTVPSTDYTLSGTLVEGTSTITVSYSGKTTTFTVTVTEGEGLWVNDTITLTGSNLVQGKISYPSIPSRITADTTRATYMSDGITASSAYAYTFEYTTSLQVSTNIGVQYLTAAGGEKFVAGEAFQGSDTAYCKDMGWQSSGYKFTAVDDISYFILTFREESGSTDITPSDITSITIRRTRVGTLLYNWDLSNSFTDTIQGVNFQLPTYWTPGQGYNLPTIGANGAEFPASSDGNTYYTIAASSVLSKGITIMIDLYSQDINNGSAKNSRVFTTAVYYNNGGDTGLMYRGNSSAWGFYNRTNSSWQMPTGDWITDTDYFSGKTIKCYIDGENYWNIYADDVFLFKTTRNVNSVGDLYIGAALLTDATLASTANAVMVVSSVRIYEGQV